MKITCNSIKRSLKHSVLAHRLQLEYTRSRCCAISDTELMCYLGFAFVTMQHCLCILPKRQHCTGQWLDGFWEWTTQCYFYGELLFQSPGLLLPTVVNAECQASGRTGVNPAPLNSEDRLGETDELLGDVRGTEALHPRVKVSKIWSDIHMKAPTRSCYQFLEMKAIPTAEPVGWYSFHWIIQNRELFLYWSWKYWIQIHGGRTGDNPAPLNREDRLGETWTAGRR